MQKQALLDAVAEGIKHKTVTKRDVLDAVDRGYGKNAGSHLQLSEILYYIGGAIVFLGIAILIGQNWSELNAFTRILVTLGSGIAAYFVGLTFVRDARTERVGQAFFFLSALVLPLGLFVTFDQAGYQTSSAYTNVLVSGALSAMYMASYAAFRKSVLLLFGIFFCTWLFFAVTSALISGNAVFGDWWRFYAYRVLVAGLSYMLLGHYFQHSGKEEFTGPLYGFGIFGFLGAALTLGGWTPDASVVWELLFPGLVFGAMFLSVYLRAKSFLVFGSGYLMIYILKITGEYFQEGLGWPFALVLAGLALIGVGYFAVYLNKKYLVAK
ncbi:MAG TPA: DUF2157 domain-containing protein [Candidatus Peribacteria bacterium]|nr:DUF2157 domain-containing protein [Candidatus Peribacteria bacterium]